MVIGLELWSFFVEGAVFFKLLSFHDAGLAMVKRKAMMMMDKNW